MTEFEKKINYFEECEREEEKERKIKISKLIKWQDKQIYDRYREEHKNGYCPHCFSLLPLSGICDCGYHI